MDLKKLFTPMLRVPYLAQIENKPLFLSRKLLQTNEMLKRGSAKLAGKFDMIFLLYTTDGVKEVIDSLNKKGFKIGVIILPKLTEIARPHPIPSYFYGYGRLDKVLIAQAKKIKKTKKSEMFVYSPEFIRTFAKYYLALKNIVEEHKVKGIFITGLVGLYESATLQLSLDKNLKIFCCQHGAYRELFVGKELLKNVTFFASGPEERRTLLGCGINDKQIFVTGSLFFNKVAKYRKRKIEKIKKTITLVTQPLAEDKYVGEKEYFDYIRKFLIQINKVKNIEKIVIKLHPREKYKSRYESIVKSLGVKNVRVTQELGKDALYSILSDSDLLISTGSTTDIEGLALGKDVIVIDGLKRGPLAELTKKDKYREAVVVIDKDNDIAGTVTKVLTGKDLQRELGRKKRRYLENSFYKIDGKAHERVADLISRLIDKNSIL